MSPVAVRWRVDPAPEQEAVAGALVPFAEGSEHLAAVRRLCASGPARVVPDEVFLHLHAYEILERVRAAGLRAEHTVLVPFWPEALFAAAGVTAHAARELESLLPSAAGGVCVVRPRQDLEREARRVLGALRFDADAYRIELVAAARRRGWEVAGAGEAAPAPGPDDGRPATASALLLRCGKLLLERRPDHARVYAGMWDTPGGHLEPGETPAQALARELKEELGIEPWFPGPTLVQDDVDPTSGREYRHHVFLVRAWGGEPRPQAARRLLWVPVTECPWLHRLNPLVREALVRFAEAGEALL
jgi:mutator protein MutT